MFKTYQSIQPRRAILASLLVIAALILAACAPSAGASVSSTNTPVPPVATDTIAPVATTAPTATSAAPSATTAAAASSGVQVNVSTKTGLGSFLVDGKGLTLYVFTKDTPGVSACTSAGCLKAWPILEATSDPVAGTGVTGKLGVITRPDGKKQVTLNDMPLYYFAADKAAGDTNGQAVGGVWYVIDASGAMIKTGGAPAPEATNTPGY